MSGFAQMFTTIESQANAALSQFSNIVSLAKLTYKQLPIYVRSPIRIVAISCLLLFAISMVRKIIFRSHNKPLQLVDFGIYYPPKQNVVSSTQLLQIARNVYNFKAQPTEFMRRICENAGLGPQTAVPANLIIGKYTIEDARDEARAVMFGAVDNLLSKTHCQVKDIGCVVTNCSLFCPTPSLAAMIVNHYKMGPETSVYNLGGQGCSASPIAADLVYAMLLKYPQYKYGLLVSTENMTQNFYKGCDKSMLLPNVLFRLGASACLFSISKKGKYQCLQLLKTHTGADDGAYKCIYQTIDPQGMTGVSLAKSITRNAQKAVTRNMTRLFVRILPITEMLRYGLQEIVVKNLIFTWRRNILHQDIKRDAPSLPRIERAIDLFCFHTGGRGVLDGMQQMFKLDEQQMAASRASLYRYGNVSSASIWYELAYLEQHGKVKRGMKVWQIAFGSGFKANSIVWRARKTITRANATLFDPESNSTWLDMIGKKDAVNDAERCKDYELEDQMEQKQLENEEFQRFMQKYADRLDQIKDVKQTKAVSEQEELRK